MYLQITTRCTMECEHCCYSCTADGEDMPLYIALRALRWLGADGECGGDLGVCIGGGEPTLHPQFERILCESLSVAEHTLVITNGSVKKRAIMLANMSRQMRGQDGNLPAFSAELSQDVYHSPIDPEVVEAFESIQRIRNTTEWQEPSPKGRAWYEGAERGRCLCEELFVMPDGTMKHCGCADAPVVGHVLKNGGKVSSKYSYGECWWDNPEYAELRKERERKLELAETE